MIYRLKHVETRELWRQNTQAYWKGNKELAQATAAELTARTDLSHERRAQGRERQFQSRLASRRFAA